MGNSGPERMQKVLIDKIFPLSFSVCLHATLRQSPKGERERDLYGKAVSAVEIPQGSIAVSLHQVTLSFERQLG